MKRTIDVKYVGRIRERVYFVSDSVENIERVMKMRGNFKSKASIDKASSYGRLIIFSWNYKFIDILRVGQIVGISELMMMANEDRRAKDLLYHIPSKIEVIDSDYLKARDKLPRVFELSGEMMKSVKRSPYCRSVFESYIDYLCEWNHSYWIVYDYRAFLIPKEIDFEAIAKYLTREQINDIRAFIISEECQDDVCNKAREIKAVVELLAG